MPEDGVGRFEDPVILVGKIEELARDAAPLQSVETRKPLCFHDPEVLPAVDNEHRRLPVLDEIRRIVLLVALGIVPSTPGARRGSGKRPGISSPGRNPPA